MLCDNWPVDILTFVFFSSLVLIARSIYNCLTEAVIWWHGLVRVQYKHRGEMKHTWHLWRNFRCHWSRHTTLFSFVLCTSAGKKTHPFKYYEYETSHDSNWHLSITFMVYSTHRVSNSRKIDLGIGGVFAAISIIQHGIVLFVITCVWESFIERYREKRTTRWN